MGHDKVKPANQHIDDWIDPLLPKEQEVDVEIAASVTSVLNCLNE
jgi:hypothetical protein